MARCNATGPRGVFNRSRSVRIPRNRNRKTETTGKSKCSTN